MERRRDQQPNEPRQAQQGQSRARQQQQAQNGMGQPQQGQGDMSQRAPNAGAQRGQQQQAEIGRAAQAQNITGESNLAGQSGGAGTRQQQQFDQGSRQPSGSGAEGRFADQIREHMEVIGPDGSHVGTVDHLEGDRIKLTRASSGTGEHRYLPCSLVAGIEGNRIRLRERGDTDFGMEADR